jgi:hypothetical protein
LKGNWEAFEECNFFGGDTKIWVIFITQNSTNIYIYIYIYIYNYYFSQLGSIVRVTLNTWSSMKATTLVTSKESVVVHCHVSWVIAIKKIIYIYCLFFGWCLGVNRMASNQSRNKNQVHPNDLSSLVWDFVFVLCTLSNHVGANTWSLGRR